jgi:hypothetical protein
MGDEDQIDAAAGGEAPADDGVTPPAAAPPDTGPGHGPVRYTRRRILVLGGALVAGFAAVITGFRALGGGLAGGRSGAFPVRSVEHVPDVPADQWVVRVDGLVDTPLTIDRTTWNELPRVSETADFHCVEGWGVDDVRWAGVTPSVLFERAGVKPEANYAVVHAYGGVYRSSLPLDLMRDPQTMLADQLDGGPLPPQHGGPLRLVVPEQLGYKNVKWVSRIELSAELVRGYWESNGYPEDAPVPGS